MGRLPRGNLPITFASIENIVPVASDAVLGGIKVRPGSGLKLEPDGTLSVDREEP